MIKFIELFRIKHYVKNIIIFLPLVYCSCVSKEQIISIILTFIGFCVLCSAIYIINDVIDKKNDILHPVKKTRPVASGIISAKSALGISYFLIFAAILISLSINTTVVLIFIFYIVLNLIYSFYLKHIILADCFTIALCFLTRIFAGCAVLNIRPSLSLIFLVFFTSAFFAFCKRKLDYNLLKDNSHIKTEKYNASILNSILLACAVFSILFCFIAILNIHLNILYIVLIPFSTIILRLFSLTNKNFDKSDPLYFIFNDYFIKVSFFLILIIIIFLIWKNNF